MLSRITVAAIVAVAVLCSGCGKKNDDATAKGVMQFYKEGVALVRMQESGVSVTDLKQQEDVMREALAHIPEPEKDTLAYRWFVRARLIAQVLPTSEFIDGIDIAPKDYEDYTQKRERSKTLERLREQNRRLLEDLESAVRHNKKPYRLQNSDD
jgi:hypothetical protein